MPIAVFYSPLPGHAAKMSKDALKILKGWNVEFFDNSLNTRCFLQANPVHLLLLDNSREMLGRFDAHSLDKMTQSIANGCMPRIIAIEWANATQIF